MIDSAAIEMRGQVLDAALGRNRYAAPAARFVALEWLIWRG
jgi:hypothetical protein